MIDIKFNDYTKFVTNLSKNDKIALGDDYSACWLFAYYVHKLYNLPISNYECVYENIVDVSEFKLYNEGIYSCFMEHDEEFHHFILLIKSDDELYLLSTYGGHKTIRLKYDKYLFLNKLTHIFIEGDKTEYAKLFGIDYKGSDIKHAYLSYTFRFYEDLIRN